MQHASHPEIGARLKRAHGHLGSVIKMIDEGRPCLELTQQLHAVENAIANAKRELIKDHIEHCLDEEAGKHGIRAALKEFKTLTRYL